MFTFAHSGHEHAEEIAAPANSSSAGLVIVCVIMAAILLVALTQYLLAERPAENPSHKRK